MIAIPEKQRAVQLVGSDQLRINESKPVFQPGPHQALCQVEVCGLCFSDLKLLKQFSAHARKSEVISGIAPDVLAQMPHYVPGEKPAVPGHETVVRIVKVGADVRRFKVGERYLVQADFRWLPTRNSNSAFGYNFEGALQEYVLVDERVITAPDGESTFIPAPEDRRPRPSRCASRGRASRTLTSRSNAAISTRPAARSSSRTVNRSWKEPARSPGPNPRRCLRESLTT